MASPKVVVDYKPVVRTFNKDYRATALVGRYSILLGWDMDESLSRTDLMGFAVRRREYDPGNGEMLRMFWLNGQKRFKSISGDYGLNIRSDQGPFQRFRWSDYTVDPSRSYSYEIIPMRGKPGNLQREASLFLNLRPGDGNDKYKFYSNRGVTAAFAYLDRFGNVKPENVPDQAALKWLSRDLKESLIRFIDNSKSGDKLRCAIYEFQDKDVAQAFKRAHEIGVDVLVIYDSTVPTRHKREARSSLFRWSEGTSKSKGPRNVPFYRAGIRLNRLTLSSSRGSNNLNK